MRERVWLRAKDLKDSTAIFERLALTRRLRDDVPVDAERPPQHARAVEPRGARRRRAVLEVQKRDAVLRPPLEFVRRARVRLSDTATEL